jgi:hypothetical protein
VRHFYELLILIELAAQNKQWKSLS